MKATLNRARNRAAIFAVCVSVSIVVIAGVAANHSRNQRSRERSDMGKPQPSSSSRRGNGSQPDRAARARIHEAYGKLPMRFEAVQKPRGREAGFISRGAGYSLFLAANEAVLRLRIADCGLRIEEIDYRSTIFTNPQSAIRNPQSAIRNPQSAVLRMKLVGASRRPRVSGVEQLQATSNYFVGNDRSKWRTNVANFAKVKYESVYPGVDLVWYGNQRQLEYDFIVAPGADPRRIKLAFAGADAITIDDEGALSLRPDGNEDGEKVRMLKPVAWQEENGARREVACDYRIVEKNQVEFRLGRYDAKLPLVIDPVLIYSTYIGGAGVDQALDIAVDADGFAYITGQTDSADFPGPSPVQMNKGAQFDAFALKLNQAGNAVVYGAWIGGRSNDTGAEIEVDAAGNVFIAGVTGSDDFPVKNALQAARKGPTDAFVVKLNSAGNDLLYSTYLGGSLSDAANALALDANGNAYVTGGSDSLDFPLKGAFQPRRQGSAFYASNNSGGNWTASGDGLSASQVYDIAIDPATPATIYAGTERGVFKSVNGGGSWSQAGASFSSLVFQIVVDPTAPANVYALAGGFIYKSADGGATWNPIALFQGVQTIGVSPTTPTATIYAATADIFFKSVDGGVNWTPINLPPSGGSPPRVFSVVIDPAAPATVYAGGINGVYRSADSGVTWTILSNGLPQNRSFSVSRLAISKSNPATILAEVFNVGVYKTTNGGSDWAAAGLPTPPSARFAFAIDPGDATTFYAGALGYGVYKSVDSGVTWNTASSGLGSYNVRALAVAQGSPSTLYAGTGSGADAFVAKINPAGSELVFSSYLGGGGGDTGVGIALDSANNVYVTGTTESPNFPAVGAYQSMIKGLSDAFVTKINPAGAAILWSTYLGGGGPENAGDIAIHAPDSVLVAGSTGSTDFPTARPIQSINKSVSPAVADAFVSRLSADGARLDFSTYLGGSGTDLAYAIAVDGAANVHLTGATNSTDFPVLSAVQAARSGEPQFNNVDAFVTKLDTNGAGLIYSTYLGGNGSDQGNGIATDGMNNVYVTGLASSGDFPTTPNPLRTGGFSDSFIAKIGIRADLAITIGDQPDPVMVNNNLTYTLTVTNGGPDPANGVTVANTLPAGVAIISVNASQGSCGASNPITCAIGPIAPNGKATITIVVKPAATASITNRATVASATPDANEANNTATQETKVSTLPSIFGRVTTGNGAGLGEVTVALTGAQRPTATTAVDGGYQFPELPARANYTVTPSRQGYVFNPANRVINDLQSDQRADFAAVACSFSISPRNQSFMATGGTGSVMITGPDSRCPWTARSDAPWIKITSAVTGNGNGVVSFSVEPTVGARIGAVVIAGVTFTVSQEFNACDTVKYKTPPVVSTLSEARTDLALMRLMVEDFNNDGAADLVQYLRQPEAGAIISLSNPTGGYDAATMVYRGALRSFRAGDLNNDGKNDLVLITSETSGRLLILLGNGAGGFSAPVNLPTGTAPFVAAIADFNGDNKLDLAVGTGSLNPPTFPPIPPTEYNVSIHFGDGAGGFSAPKNVTINTSAGSYLTQIEAGDFNGDGKTDLAVISVFGSTVILYGDGAGNFTTGGLGFFGPHGAMVTGDFNGDGKTDIAIAQGGEIRLYLSTAAGPLQTAQPLRSAIFGSGIVAADFNGDGRSDIAAPGGVGVLVVYATGDGNFAEPVSYLTPGASGDLVLADFNRDGRDDLFVPVQSSSSSSAPADLAILTANAQGEFDAPRSSRFATPFSASSPIGASVALTEDFNGDGVEDLVVGFREDQWKIAVAFGNGRGDFISPVTYRIIGDPYRFSIRDLNRDGKPDIVFLLNRGSDFPRLAMFLNDGAGGFTEKTSISLGPNPYSTEFADFNSDGNLDLIVSNQAFGQPNGLNLYLGDGRGDFTKATATFNVNINPARVVVGDFNGDRNPDLAVFRYDQPTCGFGVNPLSILHGDGRGGFSSPITLNLRERIGSIEPADFNRDGRTDLIFTGTCLEDRGFFVMLADAQGGLAPPVKYEVSVSAGIASINDFNGDGKLDVMMSNEGSGMFFFHLGKGDGSFNSGGSVRAPANPVAVGDFNGDGAIDLVLPQGGSGYAAALFNQSVCAPANFATAVSAASYARYRLAPESITATFGANLATATQTATTLPLPTTLANTSVKIKDAAGVERLSPLFFVSPEQINHLIPAGTAPGVALVTVMNGATNVAAGTAMITATSPGLFSADSSGQGLAAAVVLRVRSDNSRVFEPMVRFDSTQNKFIAVPIDLSEASEQVYLLLFGTGLRNYSAIEKVNAKVGGADAAVSYAGDQGGFAGLDQINLQLPRILQGRGDVSVELTVDGKTANAVRINIK